jgi:hypothetical protein
MTDSPWPPADRAAELHRRLAAADPLAPADFAQAFLEPLAAFLYRTNRQVDEHLCGEAAGRAIVSVVKNPSSYDPAKGELAAYLKMAAAGDLKNLLARERKHREGRVDQNPVELADAAGNTPAEGPGDDPGLSFDHPALAAVIAGLSDVDRAVLGLMRAGERKTEAFAAVLGIGHLPVGEQRAEVKREKERIFKRLRRAAGGES